MPTPEQAIVIADFLDPYFGSGFQPGAITKDEEAVTQGIGEFVGKQYGIAKYVLGLAIDFTLLAQALSKHDKAAKPFRKGLTKDALFKQYTLITSRAGKTANTLTLRFGDEKLGIRRIEESVIDLFLALKRPGYPSAYVYNTGQWHKFQDTLLVPCFSLSESARFHLCHRLIEFGMANLTEGTSIGRDAERVRLFEVILSKYPRSDEKENAGAAFQGMCAGYITADRPHLSLVVDKTRTGSARQARIGDIDGYHGLDLEVSCEVKDHPITAENVTKEVGEFLAKVKANRVMGLVFVETATEEAVGTMNESGAQCISLGNMLWIVATWDWRKQDAAVHGLLHYLAHVEQNPDAVHRLLTFISEHDPSHDSLVFYTAAS